MDVERYRIEHETRYAYRVPVSQSWQLAHLTPRELPWQHVLGHELRIEPATDERRKERDAFGNGVTRFAVYGPHPLLRVRMRAQVEIGERPDPAAAGSIAWEAVRDAVRAHPALDGLAPALALGAERPRAVVGGGARLCRAELRHRPRLARGDRPPAPADPCRLRVRARGDDGLDPGRRGPRAAQRRLPGLRPPHARLPARPGPAGALRLRLPAAPTRRRGGRGCSASTPRTPGSRPIRRSTAGSSSIRPTTPAPTSATSLSPGGPTSPTSCRCAASSSAGAARAWRSR